VSDGPTCFLHVPKSAGTSMHVALEAALPHGSVAPRRMDPAAFCGFDAFERLGPDARVVVAADEREIDELAGYAAVSGHFALSTLTRLAPPSRIGTVLREPRARLLSHYLYLRVTPGIRELWHPYDTFSPADSPLDEFLTNPAVATATDNKTCRMLLHGDPRVRDGEFIAEAELESLAEAAWERLVGLGFVGLLELGADTWVGLGDLFGVTLERAEVNTTGSRGTRPGALPVPHVEGDRITQLLERLTAADAVLYRRVAARHRGSDAAARRFADEAFAAQHERLSALMAPPGGSADC
jgi:hypothetical protein